MSAYITGANRMALKCNGPWCARTFHPRREARMMSSLRLLAHRQGWAVDPGIDRNTDDFCSRECEQKRRKELP